MNPRLSAGIRPAAALLLAAIVSLVPLPKVVRAQGPSGAGTQSNGAPSEPSSQSPAQAPAETPSQAASPSTTQSPSKSNTQSAAAAAIKPTLADLAWLTGSWQGTWGPRVAQQVWAPPKAGVMLGSFQLAENDKTLVIELFTLAETPDGVELRIRHFTPSLAPWEKNGPTVLQLTGIDTKSAVFENFVNGEPKTQSFRRVDADTYTSRSEVVPPEGDPQVAEISFRRVRGEVVPPKRKTAKQPK